jgi:hypothetical protein
MLLDRGSCPERTKSKITGFTNPSKRLAARQARTILVQLFVTLLVQTIVYEISGNSAECRQYNNQDTNGFVNPRDAALNDTHNQKSDQHRERNSKTRMVVAPLVDIPIGRIPGSRAKSAEFP